MNSVWQFTVWQLCSHWIMAWLWKCDTTHITPWPILTTVIKVIHKIWLWVTQYTHITDHNWWLHVLVYNFQQRMCKLPKCYGTCSTLPWTLNNIKVNWFQLPFWNICRHFRLHVPRHSSRLCFSNCFINKLLWDLAAKLAVRRTCYFINGTGLVVCCRLYNIQVTL